MMSTLLCLLFLMLTGVVSVVDGTAPVFGMSESADDSTPEEFLIMLKRKGELQQQDRWESVKQFCEGLEDSPVVSDVFIFHDVIVMSVLGTRRVLRVIQEHEEVELIQGNLIVRAQQTHDITCTTQDTDEQLWGLSRLSQRQLDSYVGATYKYGDQDGIGVQVYVVDSGIYIEHEDFEGRAIHGYTAKMMQTEGDGDLNGHGTHVAGTIAGKTYGAAKKTEVVAVKVLNADGGGTSKTLLEGLQWVLNDFKDKREATNENTVKGVVNLSLGVAEGQVDRLLEEVIHEIIEEGLSVVVAAGNNGADTCLESPARMSAVITVAATTESDTLASFSNYGSCVDIMAPGTNILSVGTESPTDATKLQGTSMAAPHVAGVIARFLSQINETVSHSQVKSWLLESATSGVINVRSNVDTPNKLVYMPCVGAAKGCIVYRLDSQSTVRGHAAPGGDNSKGFPVLLLMLVAAICVMGMVLIAVIVMLIKNKREYNQKVSAMNRSPSGRTTGRHTGPGYDAIRSNPAHQVEEQ